ncbi:YidH family protein [Cohnella sp.]|uniref:YidH family protein n=1 Tax=Cohnella sp. TaxID=1883426 RepID=UPI003565F34E
MPANDDSKYIQQHLANERTYLAWVRTSIAIIGLGFLTAGLIFQSTELTRTWHTITLTGGIASVAMGSSVLVLATKDYFLKQRGINEGRFRSPILLIWFVSISLGIIGVLLVFLVILMLL